MLNFMELSCFLCSSVHSFHWETYKKNFQNHYIHAKLLNKRLVEQIKLQMEKLEQLPAAVLIYRRSQQVAADTAASEVPYTTQTHYLMDSYSSYSQNLLILPSG